MVETEVLALAESEFRAADTLFRRAMHRAPRTDQQWAILSLRYEQGRVFGVRAGGELVGAAQSFASSLTVPGGAVVPAAAITAVGVRADHTRKGVLTAMMRKQLHDARERGESLAVLRASEAGIYGRFGFEVASRARRVTLDRDRAVLRPGLGRRGQVRLVDLASARQILPEVYRRTAGTRPGLMARSAAWWAEQLSEEEHPVVAVHANEAGVDDGFAVYDSEKAGGSCTLWVDDLRGADSAVTTALWRFLLGIDLVDHVVATDRPVDEPLEWWLTDRRSCRVNEVPDELWVRLVDVETALNARVFGSDDVLVLGVRDEHVPENSGSYRISRHGVHRVADRPQLTLEVSALAALYLGDIGFSALDSAGRVEEHEPGAVESAEALFARQEIPWCATEF